MNHQDTKAKDFQAKLNLPVKKAFEYKYGMQNSKISLTIPIKKEEHTFSTLANVELIVEVKDLTSGGFTIDNLFIEIDSFSHAIKNFQGRVNG